jgi:transposase
VRVFLSFINEVIDKVDASGIGPSVFVMDNVAFHRVSEVRERVEDGGHTIKFLPRYSPMLNPIENMFSQWKQLVRGENPESEEELMRSIDNVFLRITSENCSAHYRHMMAFLPASLNRQEIHDG